MESREGKMAGIFVIMMLVGMAVTGVAAGPAVNGTLAEGNGETISLLMASSERSFSVGECVSKVNEGKRKTHGSFGYNVSFPPDDFMAPGAEEWCRCLEEDSGIASLSIPRDGFTSDDLGEVREPLEQGFDRCQKSILEGSDFNAAEICGGMFDLFGYEISLNYVTFCGRICRSLENDSVPPPPPLGPYYVNDQTYRPFSVRRVLAEGCRSGCAAETMPGYCNKYRVWYSVWETYDTYSGGFTFRVVGIGETTIGTQDTFGLRNREVAQALCDALHPFPGGNKNECCNYARAFTALANCCAPDGNGFAVFDCEKYNLASISDACLSQADYHMLYNCDLSDNFNFPSDYDWTDVRVFKQTGTDHLFVDISESTINYICRYHTQGENICCTLIANFGFVANCVDQSTLTYVGRIGEGIDRPTPGAPQQEMEEDPCLGLCKEGRECVVSPNGSPFCVDCSAFLKPKRSGNLVECCTYDSENRKCASALRSSKPGICRRSEEIFVLTDEGSRQQVNFTVRRGFACASPRDFRRNGSACKVTRTRSGRVRCFE